MNLQEVSFLIMLAVMAAFYIIFIRPARQEQKRVEDTIRDLHVGDEIITTAGFYATVQEIHTPEEGPVQITLDFGNGVKIRALTTSILRRVATAPQPADQAGEPERVS